MNLTEWIKAGDLQKVEVTESTLKDILRLIERDLKDAQLEGLSEDRRFATAYGAALNLASYVIRTQGYRVTGKIGHHKITFDVAAAILGKKSQDLIDFFDLCRRKRNKLDYDAADIVSETEVIELIKNTMLFRKLIFGSSHFIVERTK